MKKFMFLLAAVATFAMVACGETEENGGGNDGAKALTTPVLASSNVTETGFTVTWAEIENADTYSYSLNGGAEKTALITSATFTDLTPETEYTVKVKAVPADTQNYKDSAWATIKVTTLAGSEPVPPTPGEVHESLKGSNYILISMGEQTKLDYVADKVVCDWRVNDWTCWNYVWNGYDGNQNAGGPNAYGIIEGWCALVTNGGWAGGGFCIGVAPETEPAAAEPLLAQMNEWMPKLTSEAEQWYFHFAMKSEDNTTHALRFYPMGGADYEISVGAPGSGADYTYERDGEWHHFDIPLTKFVEDGVVFRAEYTKGENIVGYGINGESIPVGRELNLDAVFFYKK